MIRNWQIVFLLLCGLLALAACQGAPTTIPPDLTLQAHTPQPTPVTPAQSPTPLIAPTPTEIPPLPLPAISLAGDPLDRRQAYALLSDGSLFHTGDLGLTWQRLPLPAPEASLDATAEDLQNVAPPLINAARYYPGWLFVQVGDDLWRSQDSGQNWQVIQQGVGVWTTQEDTDRFELYTWLPGTPKNKLTHSKDGGDTWETMFNDIFSPNPEQGQPLEIFSLAADPMWMGSLYLGTSQGLYRSFDGGVTWKAMESGLPPAPASGRRVPLVFVAQPNEIYLLAEGSTGDGQTEPVIARLRHAQVVPDQDDWEVLGNSDLQTLLSSDQPGFYGIYSLVPDPFFEDRLYLATQSGLLNSWDGGQHWSTPPELSSLPIFRLALASAITPYIYAITEDGLETATLALQTAALPSPTSTAPSFPPQVSLSSIGEVAGALTVYAFEEDPAYTTSGDLVYLGVGTQLVILDLTDPAHPQTISTTAVGGSTITSLIVESGLAYLSTADGQVLVTDVQQPDAPVPYPAFSLSASTGLLDLQDGVLYVGEKQCRGSLCQGLVRLLDASDPTHLRQLAQIETPRPVAHLEFIDRYAYFFDQYWLYPLYEAGLSIYDVADPTQPELQSELALPGQFVDFIQIEDWAVLAHQNGVLTFDLADPAQPQEIGSLSVRWVSAIALSQGYAYLISGVFELPIVDLSDMTHPELVGSWKIDSAFPPDQLLAYNSVLYVIDNFGEMGFCGSNFWVADLSDPLQPELLDQGEQGVSFTCAYQAEINANQLYVPDWLGFSIVDLSQPDKPVLSGQYPVDGNVDHLLAGQGVVYWTNYRSDNSLIVLDASDPAQLQVLGPVESSWSTDLASGQGYLYVAAWMDGLAIYDLRDQLHPEPLPGLGREQVESEFDEGVSLVEFAENYLYAASYLDADIMDLANPAAPRRAGSYQFTQESGFGQLDLLAAQDDLVICSLMQTQNEPETFNLVVLDASQPEKPELLTTFQLPAGYQPTGLATAPGSLYVAAKSCTHNPGQAEVCSAALFTYDLSQPDRPRLAHTLDFPGSAVDILWAEQRLFLSTSFGVWVFGISDPLAPQIVGYQPVPGGAGNLAYDQGHLYVGRGSAGLLVLEVAEKR